MGRNAPLSGSCCPLHQETQPPIFRDSRREGHEQGTPRVAARQPEFVHLAAPGHGAHPVTVPNTSNCHAHQHGRIGSRRLHWAALQRHRGSLALDPASQPRRSPLPLHPGKPRGLGTMPDKPGVMAFGRGFKRHPLVQYYPSPLDQPKSSRLPKDPAASWGVGGRLLRVGAPSHLRGRHSARTGGPRAPASGAGSPRGAPDRPCVHLQAAFRCLCVNATYRYQCGKEVMHYRELVRYCSVP